MFEARLKKLKENIKRQSLDGIFISSNSTITYLTGYSNFSNLERDAYLLLTKNDQLIITDGRYVEAIKENVKWFRILEISPKTPLENILKKFNKEIKTLALEENDLRVSEHKLLAKHFKNLKHIDIKSQRSIKTPQEIDKIEKAAKLGDKTFEYILKKIKLGISEKKLAFEMEFFIKKNGADLSFPSIIAFGKNSSVPHYQTGEDVLGPSTRSTRSGREGQIILLDFGVKLENYCSDMTRTIFLGKPSKKQKSIYNIVLKAQQKAANFINSKVKSGKQIKAKEVDKIARDYIISRGFPSIPHSLGHGIGLEVHENPHLSPKSKEILKPGMVFSIEPGIYIPDFGGVRIEDLFVLEKKGLRRITASTKDLLTV